MSESLSLRRPDHPRVVPLALLAAGLGLLGGAMVLEHGLGIAPCVLCVYQRVAPAVVVVLAAVAAWPAIPMHGARRLVLLIALAFLANTVLAGYHIGVEQHWWAGTDACGNGDAAPVSLSSSLADLRAGLTNPEVVPCNTVAWSFLGISVAGYNMILSMMLAAAALWATRRPHLWR
ncbi:disulfide bond formation protein B [Roseospira visakhapatnamensis]|uniref:Disulfide bond formation protein DsbB n=1 Tax=Roseospira visakhapatnamensis TaxID=390880 RepID=A0A7W6W8P7_9PROT|nr:disulfide bond formation protein B [Roseospira visakhapatnamensis]MBB4265084.1 disulfide bond formation protein DsbB [Roseospira visakhapatnamensis]